MTKARNSYASEQEKKDFIRESEAAFERRLDEVSAYVLSHPDVRYVTLSGPTCACKSTTVKKIVSDVEAAGKRIFIISIDDFFLDRGEDRAASLAKGEKVDYDSIEALDFDLFKDRLNAMFRGEKVDLPKFDFVSAKRSGYEQMDPREYDIIVFEGIQAIYPEITALFEGHEWLSIYIDVEGPIEIAGQTFSGRDVRYLRRIVRDRRFRGAIPSFTMFLWESVAENEDKSMVPYEHTADIHINSFIPYELGLLKGPLTETLSEVAPSDKYYGEAQRLLEKFKDITLIDADYLPADSMYREFLG